MIWRISREEFDPKCTVSTIKQGGGSVMIWDCFAPSESWKTVCIGSYHGQILLSRYFLEQNLQPSINHLELHQRCIFVHENDPKRTSGLIQDWLKREKIQTLSWLSYSPDFNLIENLWVELERRIKKLQPKSITELELLLIQEWNIVGSPVLEKLVDSVPSRLCVCIKMKGYPTKY